INRGGKAGRGVFDVQMITDLSGEKLNERKDRTGPAVPLESPVSASRRGDESALARAADDVEDHEVEDHQRLLLHVLVWREVGEVEDGGQMLVVVDAGVLLGESELQPVREPGANAHERPRGVPRCRLVVVGELLGREKRGRQVLRRSEEYLMIL